MLEIKQQPPFAKPAAAEQSIFPIASGVTDNAKAEEGCEFTRSSHKLEIDIRDDQGLIRWDNRDSDQGKIFFAA